MSRTASPIGDAESETLADCGTVSKRQICVFRLWNMRAPHCRDLTVPSSMDQHLLIAPLRPNALATNPAASHALNELLPPMTIKFYRVCCPPLPQMYRACCG